MLCCYFYRQSLPSSESVPKEGGIFTTPRIFNPLPPLAFLCRICSSISCNKWLCFTPTSTLLRHFQEPAFFGFFFLGSHVFGLAFVAFGFFVCRVNLDRTQTGYLIGALPRSEGLWSTRRSVDRHASFSRESFRSQERRPRFIFLSSKWFNVA